MTAQATVLQMPDTEAVELIREGAYLKEQIDALNTRRQEVETRLAELAEFPAGKMTSQPLEGAGYKVKVTKKEYPKWDDEKLEQARATVGDGRFFAVFKWKFTPRSKKDLDAFLAHGDPQVTAPVRAALTVTEGKPQVTYVAMEG